MVLITQSSRLYDVVIDKILTEGYSVCAILLVGSQVVPQLVDASSDVDLLVIVDNQAPDFYKHSDVNMRMEVSGVRIQWSCMSLQFLLNLPSIDPPKLPYTGSFCCLTYETITSLFANEQFCTEIECLTRNWRHTRKQCAANYIRAQKQVILTILSHGLSERNTTKAIHHIIRCGAILNDTEHLIDYQELLRIKRICRKALTAADEQAMYSHLYDTLQALYTYDKLTNS